MSGLDFSTAVDPSFKNMCLRRMPLKDCYLLDSVSGGFMNFRLPVRPTDNGHPGFGAEDLLALLVEQGGFAADLQVAAWAGFLGQLNELLGVLRGVEESAELLYLLAGHDGVGVALHCVIPLAGRQL